MYVCIFVVVEKCYGVNWYVVFVVWGIESDYGQFCGDFYMFYVFVNLVCVGKWWQKYFCGELMKMLQIVLWGDVLMKDFYGFWVGVFG